MSEYDRSSGGGHLADNATVGGTSDFLQRRLTDDMALINSMIEDSSYITYFTQPPFNRITLFFEDYKVEEEYRRVAWKEHKSNPDQESEKKALIKTVSITVLDTYFDLVTVSLLFTIVSINGLWRPNGVSVAWLVYFILTFVFLTASISILVKHLNKVENSSPVTVERHKNHRKKSVITKVVQKIPSNRRIFVNFFSIPDLSTVSRLPTFPPLRLLSPIHSNLRSTRQFPL